MDEVLKFVTPNGGLTKKTKKSFRLLSKNNFISRPFYINPMLLNVFQGIDFSTAGLLKPTSIFR